MRWSRLQQILAEHLPGGPVHLEHCCTGVSASEDGVAVHFADRPSVRVGLLVGSDGIDSVVRQTVVGDGRAQYAGRMSWRAVLPVPPGLTTPDEAVLFDRYSTWTTFTPARASQTLMGTCRYAWGTS